MELSEVFSETEKTEEVTTVEADEPETEEIEPVEATVEDDAATTAAEQDEAETQEDETEEEPPGDSKEKSEWTFVAYQEEKRKRQELEAKVKELTEKPEDDDTDLLTQSELAQRMKSYADQQVQQALFQDRLTRHYDEVKSTYDDFGEMETAFAQMASKDENLKAQFLVSPNPAEFAYKQAKNAQLLSKYNGDIQAMLEDVKKQNKVETVVKEDKPASKPRAPSLANATEGEKNSAPVESNNSLQDVFADSEL